MNARGFTLIELMIVVAIVAILAAVAVPSYQSSIRKTNRQDAREALLDFAARQEKYRLANSKYAIPGEYKTELGYASASSFTTPGGNYSITPSKNFCPLTDNSCYAMVATTIGSQASDTSCKFLALLSDGRRGSAGATGGWKFGANDTCW